MKEAVWGSENDWFTLRNFSYPRGLRNFFPPNGKPPYLIVEENKALFLNLDLFFVKVKLLLP
jgi:hypothetical protein